jgi:hypothetical protein
VEESWKICICDFKMREDDVDFPSLGNAHNQKDIPRVQEDLKSIRKKKKYVPAKYDVINLRDEAKKL